MGVKTLGHVLSACPKGQANVTGKAELDPGSVVGPVPPSTTY